MPSVPGGGDEDPMPMPSWAHEAKPRQRIPSHLGVRMHLVVGLADPQLDAADLCMHDLTLLEIVKPAPDGLLDFSVIKEPPPWAGEG